MTTSSFMGVSGDIINTGLLDASVQRVSDRVMFQMGFFDGQNAITWPKSLLSQADVKSHQFEALQHEGGYTDMMTAAMSRWSSCFKGIKTFLDGTKEHRHPHNHTLILRLSIAPSRPASSTGLSVFACRLKTGSSGKLAKCHGLHGNPRMS